jgi:proliferating cell nuclear antigen
MFRAKLRAAVVLKKIFESLIDLVDKANVECNDTGIHLNCLDSSHVTSVDLHIEINAFENYDCERPIVLGIDFKSIRTILNCASNDDSVTLEASYGGDRLKIEFDDGTGEHKSQFEMCLLNIDSESMSVPDVPYANTVSIQSETFRKTVSNLAKFGEECVIKVDNEKITFSASGQTGQAKETLNITEGKTSIVFGEVTEISFAIRYLCNYIKAISLSPVVEICLDTQYPLKVTFKQIGSIRLTFYLAPKFPEE